MRQMWHFSDLTYNIYVRNVYFKVNTDQKQKAEENFNGWKQLKSKQRQQWKQQDEKKKLKNKTGGDYRS